MDKDFYPRLSMLAYIGFETNILLENHKEVAFAYIYDGLDKQNLFQKLENDFEGDIDLSLLHDNKEQVEILNAVLAEVSEAFRGREAKKTGIEKNGLSLLMAFVIEAMQKKMWQ